MTEKLEKIAHKQESYGIKEGAEKFPLMVVIGLSYVCNSSCPSCPYTNSEIRDDYRDHPFMAEETFKIIADECGKHGAWLRVSGGGEPMLHPRATELLLYAKGAGAKVGLITNGSRFTEEDTKRIIQAEVDAVEFSVDAGDPVTYARLRAGLDWERLVGNVRRFVTIRNKTGSSTRIIASAVNQKGVDIDAVTAFWAPIVDKLQIRKYLTWGINDPEKTADAQPYLPPEDQIPCPFIFERLNIDSKGKVTVCGFDIVSVTDMGNVHEQSIEEIWHSEGFEHFRRMHLERRAEEIAMCSECPDWKYRSWKYNYWKIIKDAEETKNRLGQKGSAG